MEEVEGIVISEQKYSETSKILNVITKEYGLIGLMSKGCRSLKSPLRSVSTTLTYGHFYIYYKEGKLSTLKEVDIIDNFNNIRMDIEKLSYSTFLLELSNQVIKQSINKNIYLNIISGLKKINEGFDPAVIMNIIELKYLDYLGVMPILDCCSVCGKKTNIVTLSSDKGGYVCRECHTEEQIVNEKTIKLIRMFYYVDIDKISNLEINEKYKKEINVFLDEYYDRYTGLYLKSKKFISELEKVGK